MDHFLEVKDAVSGYGRMMVLQGLSMHVVEGEFVCVVGPNGAGKSTLLNTISGAVALKAGDISMAGVSVAKMGPAKRRKLGLGLVPQINNVFPDLTVEENLDMSCFGLGVKSETATEVVRYFPDIAEKGGQKAGTLSGGERQQLATAMALVGRPRLLLLDEPTAGLSPQMTASVMDAVKEENESGTTVVWVVEENPMEVLKEADRAYFVEGGVIKHEEKASALMEEETLERLFLGQVVG
ncbi:MAG: ABC transporter ATP-binding protein [Actinobacteria bacterium]|nr:ABC transporter ATP-binding protein [Actinomycetota bacterium]